MTTVTFLFAGRFEAASFAEFARHRTARLVLSAGAPEVSPGEIRITVSGPEALLDAFEMACSLGPRDCMVADVLRLAGPVEGLGQ